MTNESGSQFTTLARNSGYVPGSLPESRDGGADRDRQCATLLSGSFAYRWVRLEDLLCCVSFNHDGLWKERE